MKAFINPQWAEALGLTLFDSLWQGALVLIASFVVLLFMKKASPAKRYALVLVAILILPILSVATFLGHLDTSAATSAISTSLNFENDAVFSFELGEATTPAEQAILPITALAKWKAWTSQNANLALVIWLMGAFLFTVRMLGGFYFLNRLKSRAIPITDSAWLEKVSALCTSLKIKGKVLLKETERVSSPLVMGVIKPVIIFPMGLIQALPTDEIEAILVHELAHIKRKDFLINIVINLLQVVYFFHPAFWWLKSQLDAEREYHCDDITLNQLGKKLTLIRALTNASEYQGQKFQPALAFAGKKNQLLNRVKRIAYHKPQMNWLSGFMSLGVLVLSFVLMSQDVNQEDKPEMDDLLEDNIENLMQESAPQDTTKVKKAILELLKQDSKVTVKTDASGTVTMIMNDKTEITGEEFEAYKAAYNQIHKFSEESQRTKEEELQELAELVNVKKRKIEVAMRRAQLEELMIERTKLEKSAKTETEAERSAKTQADQEIIRAEKVLKQVVEKLKTSGQSNASVVEKAEVTQQEIIEWVEKVKKEEEKLVEAQAEVRKIQGRTGNYLVTQRNNQQERRYDFMGKVLTEEELKKHIYKGLTVTEVIDQYSVFDFATQKEKLVELVKLEEKAAAQKVHEDTARIAFSSVFESIKKTGEISPDTSSVYYAFDGKLISRDEVNKLDYSKIIYADVLKNKTQIQSLFPEIQANNPELIRFLNSQDVENYGNELIKTFPYYTSDLDFSTMNFDDAMSNSIRTSFVIATIKEDNAIIEIDGELKPDMTEEEIKALDLMNVKSIQIIKNDKMNDYHRKRKLKGYDALIRIVTK